MRTLIISDAKVSHKTRRAAMHKVVNKANDIAERLTGKRPFDIKIVGKVTLTEINRTKTVVKKSTNDDARKASIARLAVVRAIFKMSHDINNGIVPSFRDIYRCGIRGYKNATRILTELISLVKERFGRIKNLLQTKITNLWQSISTYINKDTFISLLNCGMTIHMA